MREKSLVVGSGICPNCITETAVIWREDDDTVIEWCGVCGRSWSPKRKKLPAVCSCGCDHIQFSEVINSTWMVVKSACKCPGGKYKTHTLSVKESA
jgi:Zn ribbon nucleic-acid-binding protein